jgi:hypothetical protein
MFVMFILGEFLFIFITKTVKSTQQSPITLWEIYFLGVLIPYGVGGFFVFAFGD